ILACIFLGFTTPDGEPLFNSILGVLGLSPGISLGSGATLYIYGLVPIVIIILCIAGIIKYWRGYGLRFQRLNVFLRLLPVIIAGLMLFSNAITPSVVDRIYFARISRQSGLAAVTFYPLGGTGNHLRFITAEDGT
ncbi:MAG: hypothetical protein FWC32_02480, partial [Firmicutes bacterium]|nr:hypothetical protein [Bacillota bacterium]